MYQKQISVFFNIDIASRSLSLNNIDNFRDCTYLIQHTDNLIIYICFYYLLVSNTAIYDFSLFFALYWLFLKHPRVCMIISKVAKNYNKTPKSAS